MPGLRHPSWWNACHHQAGAAEAVRRQRLEAAAAPADDPFPWAAAGANPGHERHPVRQAKEHSAVACQRLAAMPSAERALQSWKAVVVAHPHQAAEVAAHPCPSQAAGAEAHSPCEAAEVAGHRRHPTSLAAECTHREVEEVLHRTAAEVPAGHLHPWEAAGAVHPDHPACPYHPSWAGAEHLEHPSWAGAEHLEHPSWEAEHLVHPWEAAEAAHPAYPCRPSSEAAEAVHPACPSSAEVQAAHPACPCHPSWAEELPEDRRHTSGAWASHLEPADNPAAAVTVAQREFPPSMAASAARIPAPLPRCVEHPGTACAGCSCAAEHTASSTR